MSDEYRSALKSSLTNPNDKVVNTLLSLSKKLGVNTVDELVSSKTQVLEFILALKSRKGTLLVRNDLYAAMFRLTKDEDYKSQFRTAKKAKK